MDDSGTFLRADIPATRSEARRVPVVGRLGRKGKERSNKERAEDHDVVETRNDKVQRKRRGRKKGVGGLEAGKKG